MGLNGLFSRKPAKNALENRRGADLPAPTRTLHSPPRREEREGSLKPKLGPGTWQRIRPSHSGSLALRGLGETAGAQRAQSSSQRRPRGTNFFDYVLPMWMSARVSACGQVTEKQWCSGVLSLPSPMWNTGFGLSALPPCPRDPRNGTSFPATASAHSQ